MILRTSCYTTVVVKCSQSPVFEQDTYPKGAAPPRHKDVVNRPLDDENTKTQLLLLQLVLGSRGDPSPQRYGNYNMVRVGEGVHEVAKKPRQMNRVRPGAGGLQWEL